MSKHSILIVDDDPSTVRLMARILSGVGDLRAATNGTDALRLAREAAPDLILLDAEMPGMSGFEVCETVKADPALADCPVIFITSHSGAAYEVAGLEIGATDFIAKPVSPALLLARVNTQLRIKRLTDGLRQISLVDALTGIANRRCFDETLEREWMRARRSCEAFSLLLVDVDCFKDFNDCYGHLAGDACIRSLAQALVVACLRPADLVARYGGEEFAILLPQTPRAGARHIADRVLEATKALGIAHETSLVARHVTVSIGVGCYDEASPSWSEQTTGSRGATDRHANCTASDLVLAADAALYAAKHAGRAQVKLRDIADAAGSRPAGESPLAHAACRLLLPT